ncbi:MAG: TetR/AcrR family transcriptional regulator [Ignavibacteria bacterium]|nr:TetR/AcrR family transcriptional regulator [Ignavibacteria bacterium]
MNFSENLSNISKNNGEELKDNKRKELIVRSARERFARFGFKKTTMDDIAADLRMGKATMYYYYKSKEEIFEAVVKSEFDEFKKSIELLEKDSEKNFKEKLQTYFQIRQKTFDDGYNLMQVHIDAVGLMHMLHEKSLYFELIDIEENFLRTIIKEHFKKEKKSEEEIEAMVGMISKFARGLILMTKVDSRRAKQVSNPETQWEIFVNAISK